MKLLPTVIIVILLSLTIGGIIYFNKPASQEYFITCSEIDYATAQAKVTEVQAKGWSNCEIRQCNSDPIKYAVYCPEICPHGTSKCEGMIYYTCSDSPEYGFPMWFNQGASDRCGAQCDVNGKYCINGKVCVNYQCVTPQCTTSAQCGINQICSNRICQDVTPECTTNMQCNATSTCISNVCKQNQDQPDNIGLLIAGISTGLLLIGGTGFIILRKKKR